MKKGRKILIVCRMSPRQNSRTLFLAETLSTQYNIVVICESPNYNNPPFIGDLKNVHVIEHRLAFGKKRFWYFTAIIRVAQLNIIALWQVLTGSYSAVISEDIPNALSGVFAKTFFGIPFILNTHEIYWSIGLSYNHRIETFWKIIEKALLKYADLWLIPSKERAEITLASQQLKRDYVVYENFPIFDRRDDRNQDLLSRVNSQLSSEKKLVVMFQGTLVPKRGLEELIDACQDGSFHSLIQGAGALESELRRRAHENITFLPLCPNHETLENLRNADISFVYYPNNSLNSAYACSSKFYASIFAGVPILCNRLPAFEIFSANYGGVFFFDELTPERINASIQDILSDPDAISQRKIEVLRAREILENLPREEIILKAFSLLLNRGKKQ